MAKRRPEQQLTQNNWDDELEKVEGGQFQKADETEMKKRVIRVAKRRIGRESSDEADANESGAKPGSVFSGFSLISNKSSMTGTDAAAPKPMFSFTSSFSSQPSATPFTSSSTMVGSAIFGGQSKTEGSKLSEFVVKLKELNDAVLDCIKGHIESGQACILTPIFKDYDKYVKDLEDKHGSGTTSSPAKANNVSSTASTAAPFAFSFGTAKSTAATESVGTNAASSIVSAPTQSASVAPTFSFGKPSTAFGTSSAGFSFSSAIQTTKPADTENKTDGGTNGNTENADDENDEPPKVEFKPVVEEESIYSKRCKVFVKEDGDYKDRGTGTLYLKRVKDDKVQLIVRADTNLGNILLNFLLTSASPPKRLKNNAMMVCVPTPESDPTKPKSVLVRVKTEDDANELIQEIEQYQK